ncbi:MAG: DNA methyltransferase, partial [Promethearchaeota archaeon]
YKCACSNHSLTKEPDGADIKINDDLHHSTRLKRVLRARPALTLQLRYGCDSSNGDRGASFIQLRHDMRNDPRLANLFTPRNLIALDTLYDEINDKFQVLGDESLLNAARFIFSSNLPQCSKMVWVIKKRASRKIKRHEVGSWTHHFLWNPSEFFEVNVLNGFNSRVQKASSGFEEIKNWNTGLERWVEVGRNLGKQDGFPRDSRVSWIERASCKSNSFEVFHEHVPLVFLEETNLDGFFYHGAGTAAILNRSSCHLPEIPDNSVDFIFTDPPYGDSIQYLELSAFFLAWIPGMDLKTILDHDYLGEITMNKNQGKDLQKYKSMLKAAFIEASRVLRPGKFIVITFHNTDMRIRGAILESILEAGFSFRNIMYQPPPRPSEKSLLHEFGTPIGDYILTFSNDSRSEQSLRAIDDPKQTLEAAITNIFATRGEHVPFNFLLNLVDIDLLTRGFIPPAMQQTLETFLKNCTKFEWTRGKGWYFSNDLISRIHANEPLSERVTSFTGKLKSSVGKERAKSMDFIVNAIFHRFNGIETPDLKFIKKLV